MKRFTQFILAFTLCISGCQSVTKSNVASTIPPLQKKSYFKDISNSNLFPEVGSIRDVEGNLIGSGVLIAPNAVLTAGHVIDDTTSFMFRIGEWDVSIKERIPHPRYSGRWGIRNDIGIVILACDITDIEPATLHYAGHIMRRSPLITVGFSRGYKKQSLPDTFFYYGTLMEDVTQIKFLPLKDTIWFGDSGGAVYSVVNGRRVLVGVISSLSIAGERIFENSATKVQFYHDWIMEVLDGREINEGVGTAH